MTAEMDSMMDAAPAAPLEGAKDPVGTGAIAVVGPFLATVLAALGVVAIRDALIAAGMLDGRPWVTAAVESLDGLRPATWMLPAGVLLVLLGGWLVLTALKPRPRTAVPLRAETGVYLRPRDVGRLAVAAAEGVDGVLSATADASRRKVTVRAITTGDDATTQAVSEAVSRRLEPLQSAPAVKVTATSEGDR